MNYHGIILGLATFLCIGLFHPIVIKSEYHFGVKCWPAFLVMGIAGCIGSLFVSNIYYSREFDEIRLEQSELIISIFDDLYCWFLWKTTICCESSHGVDEEFVKASVL